MVTSLFIRIKNKKYTVVCEYRDAITKKKKQKQLGRFDTKRAAKLCLADEKVKLARGLFVQPHNILLYDYLIDWNNRRKDKLSITTYNYYNEMINCKYNKDTLLGNTKLQDLNAIMVENFYSELKNQGLANNTIAKHHKLLNKALDDAKKKQLIFKNVCEYVERVKTKKSNVSRSLTQNEVQKLLEASKNTIYEAPINLALGLGLRSGEVFGLTWDNIDFEKNTVKIDKVIALNKATREVFFKEPKTISSARTILMPATLSQFLKKYKLKQVPNDYNLVIVNKYSKPYPPSNFSKSFQGFLEKNKFDHLRFHDLRHTNASLHLLAGTDLKVTSKNLGHSSIGITADLYTHVLQELDEAAATNINLMLYEN